MDDDTIEGWITLAAGRSWTTPSGRSATNELAAHLLLIIADEDEQAARQVRRVLRHIVHRRLEHITPGDI